MRVLGVIAAGGALGSAARYGVGQLLGFGWGTLAVNTAGCFLIGVLMVLVTDWHPLARPFLGVGVLGGFTTFSAYTMEVRTLSWLPAAGYLVLTVVLALSAVAAGVLLTRRFAA